LQLYIAHNKHAESNGHFSERRTTPRQACHVRTRWADGLSIFSHMFRIVLHAVASADRCTIGTVLCGCYFFIADRHELKSPLEHTLLQCAVSHITDGATPVLDSESEMVVQSA
jgi:hypothetical protein